MAVAWGVDGMKRTGIVVASALLVGCGPNLTYDQVHQLTDACVKVGGLPAYRMQSGDGVYQVICTAAPKEPAHA